MCVYMCHQGPPTQLNSVCTHPKSKAELCWSLQSLLEVDTMEQLIVFKLDQQGKVLGSLYVGMILIRAHIMYYGVTLQDTKHDSN